MSNGDSRNDHRIRLCLLVSSLEFGGAERQVVTLARSFDHDRVTAVVCSLSEKVPLATSLPHREQSLRIVRKWGRFDFTTVFRVARLLRRNRTDVVHAFLFDAEIVARLAALIARVPVVVASERNTDYTRPLLHRAALWLTKPLFDVMIANSQAGKRFNMRTLGLSESRIEVVHNGVDVEHFRPDVAAGGAFRRKLNIPADDRVMGMVGSFKRQKAHDAFLRTAARVRGQMPRTWFLIVGDVLRENLTESNRYKEEIKALAESLGLADRCLFLESQKDMKAVYNACDLTVLLSTREGTPNVLLESMACGVPVIASDVADNAIIVLDKVTGYVVPKNDEATPAEHAVELLGDPAKRKQMGAAAREHVRLEYSINTATEKMEKVYRTYLGRKHRYVSARRWRSISVKARTSS